MMNVEYKGFDIRKLIIALSIFAGLMCLSACEDFVAVDAPTKELSPSAVFSDEKTAEAAVLGIYIQVWNVGYDLALTTGLSSDELNNYSFDANQIAFFENELIAENTLIKDLWAKSYSAIYSANSVLEGLQNSTVLKDSIKSQLEGEARFMRAFVYFYLVNLFGEVPLVTSTDYRENSVKPRSGVQDVYDLITGDLTDAKVLLNDQYITGQRLRPNKSAASALLARVYLYQEKWSLAEEESTHVIGSGLYTLNENLNDLSLPNNVEAIFQFFPYFAGLGTYEGFFFVIQFAPPSNVTLSERLVNSFEPGDLRSANWIGSVNDDTETYYFPHKYKVQFSATADEYSTAMRLGELFLIRAEARARLNSITGSQADLNAIRTRAGLPNTTASDQSSLLDAIELERNSELFSEWGHRWLDLKRTEKIDEVLGPLKAEWQPADRLYPIPAIELSNNPNITQNAGY